MLRGCRVVQVLTNVFTHPVCSADPLPCLPCSSKFEQLVKPLLDRTVQVGSCSVQAGWLNKSCRCRLSVHVRCMPGSCPAACTSGAPDMAAGSLGITSCALPAMPAELTLVSPALLPLSPSHFLQPCHNCMKDAGVQPADIQEVLMVGGMSRMPKVRAISCLLFRVS